MQRLLEISKRTRVFTLKQIDFIFDAIDFESVTTPNTFWESMAQAFNHVGEFVDKINLPERPFIRIPASSICNIPVSGVDFVYILALIN